MQQWKNDKESTDIIYEKEGEREYFDHHQGQDKK